MTVKGDIVFPFFFGICRPRWQEKERYTTLQALPLSRYPTASVIGERDTSSCMPCLSALLPIFVNIRRRRNLSKSPQLRNSYPCPIRAPRAPPFARPSRTLQVFLETIVFRRFENPDFAALGLWNGPRDSRSRVPDSDPLLNIHQHHQSTSRLGRAGVLDIKPHYLDLTMLFDADPLPCLLIRCRVVFRDVKPGALLVPHGGHEQLLEFGSAKFFDLRLANFDL